MMSEKIGPQHLRRKAMLYVRQSSPHQVMHNRESDTLQYAMTGRLQAFGFSRIEVVDADLGRSAAGAVACLGFERMVAEICLGTVGAVAARAVSRFAKDQPRLAAAGRDVPRGRHAADRPGHGVRTAPEQRAPPARAQG